MNKRIAQLVDYAIKNQLIDPLDRTLAINRLMEALGLLSFEENNGIYEGNLEEILDAICDYVAEKGMIDGDSIVQRDLFDTKIMGLLTPMPHEVIHTFRKNYEISPEKATEEYYRFSRATNYIRTQRVARDLKWVTPSPWGDIDITINLSKPEKDPKAIAAAKNAPQSGYPQCALCYTSEGYSGHMNAAARQNHRIIPINIGGKEWYLQYSPYVYYNEHCIALAKAHTPMKIDRNSFEKMLDFVEYLPHYFIGSNADLPIVGGSILSHDHMQGGHYTFAMEKAEIEKELVFQNFEGVKAGIVNWPMSVIRIRHADKKHLVDLAEKILNAWRCYTDEAAFIYAQTDGEKHSTITPIARRRGDEYELDLVLRNNITTEQYPLGLYHPHPEKHNIKKENIGLIEVMGLAVLPSRLKKEMELVQEALLAGKDISSNPEIEKHAAWVTSFADKYDFNQENTMEILKQEIGKVFVAVLCDAGVYKCNENGRKAFMRFCKSVGLNS